MNIKPLFDRVVLIPLENENSSKGGIFLPKQAQENSQFAKVVAVGSGENFDGKNIGMQVKEGDKVLYGKFSGTEVVVDDVKYVVIRQTDILAIVD